MKEVNIKTQQKAENGQPKNEIEVLKAQVKELTERLNSQPKTMEEKIQFYKTKEEQIKRLSTLDNYATNTEKIIEEVQSQTNEEIFLTENYSLKVTKKQGYSNEQELLVIRSPKVIGDVLHFALDSINQKRKELTHLINN